MCSNPLVCVLIPISMYCILNIYAVYFLKFIVYAMNFEIFKSGMVKLIEREKIDVADADVVVGWIRLKMVFHPATIPAIFRPFSNCRDRNRNRRKRDSR
jgi:hypothetical protein